MKLLYDIANNIGALIAALMVPVLLFAAVAVMLWYGLTYTFGPDKVEGAAPVTIGIKSVQIHYFVDEEHNAECWVVYKKSEHFGGAGISCLRLQLEGIQLLPLDITGPSSPWPGGAIKPDPKPIPSPLELNLDKVTQP